MLFRSKEDVFGNVSTDPLNHEKMTHLRNEKVQRIANYIPEQEITGEKEGDVLVVSWGGTFGAVEEAVELLQKEGKKVSHTHFHYIMPLPKNTSEVLKGFKKILVCELNSGQFVNYLKMTQYGHVYTQYNKVQGLPFTVTELVTAINKTLEEK